MGRNAREKLINNNDYVWGVIQNPDPTDIEGAQAALKFHERMTKGDTVADAIRRLEK